MSYILEISNVRAGKSREGCMSDALLFGIGYEGTKRVVMIAEELESSYT